MFDVMKAIQIAKVVGDVLKVGGEAAASLKAGLAQAGVEVTEAEWDELDAGFQRIADKREIAAGK
jgi:hypothetical protein